jgi:hypothetical protein
MFFFIAQGYLTDEFTSGGFEDNSSSYESQLSEDEAKVESIKIELTKACIEPDIIAQKEFEKEIIPAQMLENDMETNFLSSDCAMEIAFDPAPTLDCEKEENTNDEISMINLDLDNIIVSEDKVQTDNKLESRKRKCESSPLATSTVKKVKPNKIPPTSRVLRNSSREPDSAKSNQDSSASEDLPIKAKKISETNRRVLRSSSREKEKVPEIMIAEKKKKVTRVEELKNGESDSNSSEIDSINRKSKLATTKRLLIKSEKESTVIETEGKKRGRKKRSSIEKSENKKKVVGTSRSKMIIFSSDSDDNDNDNLLQRNREFKSEASDSNSNHKSSILERNDYLKFSSLDKRQNKDSSLRPLVTKIRNVLSERKKHDVIPVSAPVVKKRSYLRSSAFTGNHDQESDEEPSVSKDNSVATDNAKKTNSETNVAHFKSLLEKLNENDNVEPKKEETKVEEIIKTVEKGKRGRKKREIVLTEDPNVKKRIFTQEPVEKSKENLVPYDLILDSIRFSAPAKKVGRLSTSAKKEEEEKQRILRVELEKLEYFSCGNCKNRITKHKWREHVIDHGGLTWIENYESSIDLNEWNESLRRLVNCMKYYKLEAFNCQNCKIEKKSALGHLSHIYVCCEDLETIEARKHECPLCKERMMPYNMSHHKLKCTNVKAESVDETIAGNEGDDEQDENDDTGCPDALTGRLKRRAVKK